MIDPEIKKWHDRIIKDFGFLFYVFFFLYKQKGYVIGELMDGSYEIYGITKEDYKEFEDYKKSIS